MALLSMAGNLEDDMEDYFSFKSKRELKKFVKALLVSQREIAIGIQSFTPYRTTRLKMRVPKKFLEHETRKRKVRFWGQDYFVKPYLVKKIFGDGLQVIYFGSIDQRPHWWVVRIDSNTDLDNDFNFEDVLCAIEEECGGEEYSRRGNLITKYPGIVWGGGHWGLIKNFGKPEQQD